MTRLLIIALLAMTMAGCAILPRWGEKSPSPADQRRKLDQAVELIKSGHNSAAGKILVSLSREKGIPGITDEALFRLGLLSLRSGTDKKGMAATTLERLQKEYPASLWSKTAASVLDLITQYEDVRSQNRNLKNVNQTLSKENRELLQNIERLKHLDLELEQKPRQGK